MARYALKSARLRSASIGSSMTFAATRSPSGIAAPSSHSRCASDCEMTSANHGQRNGAVAEVLDLATLSRRGENALQQVCELPTFELVVHLGIVEMDDDDSSCRRHDDILPAGAPG